MRLASAFDGSFYPAERDALEEVVDLFLQRAPARPAGTVLGALVPHAGYVYSGRTAGMAIGALRGLEPEVVIVLAPSHRVQVRGCRVFRVEGFETPLGPIGSAVDVADELTQQLGPQASGPAFCEHAIEVQLPLLARALPGVPVVAIAFGLPSLELARRVASALDAVGRTRRVLVVASSDLSHYYTREVAGRLDGHFRELLLAADAADMARSLEAGEAEACGAGPVLTLMALAERHRGRFALVDQTDSSEASGDAEQVVGYLSAIALSSEGA
jgi:AmmeMemoRadiSam system protein B